MESSWSWYKKTQLNVMIFSGAFAKVKEALHVVTGEKVAVKIIDKTKAKQDNYLWKNLRREVGVF